MCRDRPSRPATQEAGGTRRRALQKSAASMPHAFGQGRARSSCFPSSSWSGSRNAPSSDSRPLPAWGLGSIALDIRAKVRRICSDAGTCGRRGESLAAGAPGEGRGRPRTAGRSARSDSAGRASTPGGPDPTAALRGAAIHMNGDGKGEKVWRLNASERTRCGPAHPG